MDLMSLEHKQSFMKTIQILNAFIQKRRYSKLMNDTKLKIITPVGEEIDIYTAADAEACKERIQMMLDMERLYSR